MDFETFFETVLHFFKSSENAVFLLYAVLTSVLTQVCKKIFVNKVKVELFNKFNAAVFLPFVFGAAFAAFDLLVVKKQFEWSITVFYDCLLATATIGAFSGILFKFVSSLSGQRLSQLLKDETFSVFYNQLVHFSILRDKLKNGETTLSEFINETKVVAANASAIYGNEGTEDEKRRKLVILLNGLIDDDAVETAVSSVHKALYKMFSDNCENEQK